MRLLTSNNYSAETLRLLVINSINSRILNLFPWISVKSIRKLRLLYLSLISNKKITSTNEFDEFTLFFSKTEQEIDEDLLSVYDRTIL